MATFLVIFELIVYGDLSCKGNPAEDKKVTITQSDFHSENPYFGMTAAFYWNSPMHLNRKGNIKWDLGPLLLTWFNFNPSMDK